MDVQDDQDMLDHTIVGTAGHIDHGKSALIRALTGVETDTLAEEKRRGITIELGFAFMDCPGTGREILFIDVPGHEKLVKTMVAGASNLDAVLLVVAADEGVSVQTLEHFEILQLFDIPEGVVALTKSDLVDADRLRVVTEEIKALTFGSFLETAPITPVSSATGEGVDEVRSALIEIVRRMRPRRDTGIFRMPIDRAFSMTGFGAVIAGTILSGQVKVGDKLEILPDGLTSRVRSIQVHSKSVEKSHIGIRTAINLMDVKKDQLRRGQTAVAPGSVMPTERIDAHLHVLRTHDADLTNRTRVRFHVGADEVMARLVLLDCEKLSPGQGAVVQFILESPTVAVPKDRFVIRTFSSQSTVGGGAILDAQAGAHKRFDESTIEALGRLGGGLSDAVEQAYIRSGLAPLRVSEAAAAVGESEDDVAEAVRTLVGETRLVRLASKLTDREAKSGSYISTEAYQTAADKLVAIIEEFYSRNPYRVFMPASDLQSRFLKVAGKQVYDCLIYGLAEEGKLRATRVKIGIAGRQPQWKAGERELAARIEKTYESAGYSTPPEDELQAELRISPAVFANIMTALTDAGLLVRLSDKVTYHVRTVRAAREFVGDTIKANGGVTAPDLRDKLGVTRKYAIAILEHLDNVQFTRRLGDKRVLKQ